ncbi:cytidylyltransferase family protein [Sulfolobus sp. S-194]|uniref:DUF357 domain-containing protein n=1 Tax=Sulfolobus sp. S-194 TaxID=2512240 RepID=UPI0014372CDF|nr:DUF357 domain-containing protein [Sulfolobus sp. S-194]QIW24192.1 cytidylyltransferase family protein [Sulfolobus sp. S-194]
MSNEIRNRVEKYIKGMEERLQKIPGHIYEKYRKVLDLARQYTEDAKYYLNKEDEVTALVDVVYAEGLLDSVVFNENLDIDSQISKKVFVGGTFDILHPGHIEFLREASRYGRVYVSVARDKNSEKIKRRKPINDENQRLEVVKSIRYVYEAFLGDEKDFLKSVERVKPDILFLGPDQQVDENKLKEELKKRGINNIEIIRMKERINNWSHSSTTSIIQEIVKRYCNQR